MQLHQFLRFLSSSVPIMIFDVEGIEICEVASKDDIDINLYEYPILLISVCMIDFKRSIHGISITIQK